MSRPIQSRSLHSQLHFRNLGIVAHVDAGKTTLTERILLYAGRLRRPGEVHDGGAHMDSDVLEQRKGITISAAAIHLGWQRNEVHHGIHLIDTPGHVDFAIEVERSLRVLDGAVVVIDAVNGVEPQTQAVVRQARRHGVPLLAFVNKFDKAGADLGTAVASLQNKLGVRPVVLTLPVFDDDGALEGVLDVIGGQHLRFAGEHGAEVVASAPSDALAVALQTAQQQLLDHLADVDDDVAAAFLSDEEVSEATVRQALRLAVLRHDLLPVVVGSAYKNIGVQPLLDAVCDLLPSPEDVHVDRDDALLGFVFKVEHGDHGAIAWVRMYNGDLAAGAKVRLSSSKRDVRVGRVARLDAGKLEPQDAIVAGDIGAVVGWDVPTGATVFAAGAPAAEPLESLHVPPPVVAVAVEPSRRGEHKALAAALAKMAAADPSLQVSSADGQLVLAGQGELHLEVVLTKVQQAVGFDVVQGPPRVQYSERLTGTAEVRHRFRRQGGGPGMFAELLLRVQPIDDVEQAFGFESRIKGGAVPAEYLRGVERGCRSALAEGPKGFAVHGVQVVVLDGMTHVQDSSDLAFEKCAQEAVRLAVAKAGTALLEPMVRADVHTDVDSVGTVVSEVQRRRGQVLALDDVDHGRCVTARVPLVETFGWMTQLRSATHGQASLHMQPDGDAMVPAAVAAQVLND